MRGVKHDSPGLASRKRLPILSTCLGAGALMMGVLAISGSASASAPQTWSVTSTPTPANPTTTLSGVSCVSPTDCTAVGGYAAPKMHGTLIEHWDGSSWSIVPSPNATNYSNGLSAVACTSSTACVAVGEAGTTSSVDTLIEMWDGSSWSIVPSPSVRDSFNYLDGVSCAGPTFCVAVGSSLGTQYRTLAESWNGTSWSIVPSPSRGAGFNDQLVGVACDSATDCWAAGNSFTGNGSTGESLLEHWDGSVWNLFPNPNPSPDWNAFGSVSCTSATSCFAVGSEGTSAYTTQTLVEAFDGSAWSVVGSANVGPGTNALTGISCLSSTDCQAVGLSAVSGGPQLTLAEAWDGTQWTVEPSQNGSSYVNQPNGVACVSDASCETVGYFTSSNGPAQTLSEAWDGTQWSLTPGANLTNGDEILAAVSCNQDDQNVPRCAAVGNYASIGITPSITEEWQPSRGPSWTALTASDPGTVRNELHGVSCVAASCVSVGDATSGTTSFTVANAWGWSSSSPALMSTPNNGSGNNDLNAVSCIEKRSGLKCMAVGSFASGSTDYTLAEYWNASWSITSSPDPGSGDNVLNGVSCVSATDCVAVGSYDNGTVRQTLVENWDGTSWSVVASPDPGSVDNVLNGISCVSPTDCVAVGSYDNGTVRQTLVENWDGTSWSVVASPDPGSGDNVLNGVSCVSSTECVAVGSFENGTLRQTLVEDWDGTGWSVVASPDQGQGNNALTGVSCSGGTCVAVGTDTVGSTLGTLVLTGLAPPPTITTFKPTSGRVGARVVITGTNLLGTTKVVFGLVNAAINKDTDTKLVTYVPTGARTGKIKVTTQSGTATSSTGFKVP